MEILLFIALIAAVAGVAKMLAGPMESNRELVPIKIKNSEHKINKNR